MMICSKQWCVTGLKLRRVCFAKGGDGRGGAGTTTPLYIAFTRVMQKKEDESKSDADVDAAVRAAIYLFPNTKQNGELIFTEGISADTLSGRLKKLVGIAGYSEREFSMHGIVS
jgi:hypothetical protein